MTKRKRISEDLIDEVFGDSWPGWIAEHAALTETSLMLFYNPDLVRRDRMDAGFIPEIKPYKLFPQRVEALPASGVYAPLASASAEIGEIVSDRIAEGIAACMEAEFE